MKNLGKLAFDYYYAKTQEEKCGALTMFNLLSYKEKIQVIHKLFKMNNHEKVKELLMSVEYRNDFPMLLSDQGIYLFYISCLYGTPQEKDIV